MEEQIKRDVAGRDSEEHLSGSMLKLVPFLWNCEDEDSGKDDGLDSVQHKKQHVKLPSQTLVPKIWRTMRTTQNMPSLSLILWAQERMGRVLQTLSDVLKRGPTMSWKAGGSNSREFWLTFGMWVGCPGQ